MRNFEFNSKKYLIVLTKEAGKGSFESKQETILKLFNKFDLSFDVINLDQVNENINFTDYTNVIAVGGDGTVLKIVPFLVNTTIKLGIIPCGTANLFAASMSIPSNIEKAFHIAVNGTSSKVDIGKAGNDYFALRVGFGYDAEVVNNTNRFWKKKLGYLAYFIQGIISTFKLSHKSYKVTLDNKTFDVNANSIIVANAGNMFRNICKIIPDGSTSDGKLDVLIVLAKNFWEFIFIFLQIVFGKHLLNPKVIYSKAKNIKIETNSIKMHIDGEPYSKSILDISILPNALMVMTP